MSGLEDSVNVELQDARKLVDKMRAPFRKQFEGIITGFGCYLNLSLTKVDGSHALYVGIQKMAGDGELPESVINEIKEKILPKKYADKKSGKELPLMVEYVPSDVKAQRAQRTSA